ncbi:MAG: hypothetical protein Q8L49_02790 [Burkholderiaceae bacterium]|nr:hypothetical protein [Burkholderiaceae bacterium]
MMMRSTMALAVLALVAAGCAEKAQTATASKKVDAKAWESASSPYAAADWKGGDQAAWEAQMRTRAQGQNEYSRSAATPPAAAPTKTP